MNEYMYIWIICNWVLDAGKEYCSQLRSLEVSVLEACVALDSKETNAAEHNKEGAGNALVTRVLLMDAVRRCRVLYFTV